MAAAVHALGCDARLSALLGLTAGYNSSTAGAYWVRQQGAGITLRVPAAALAWHAAYKGVSL
jgi:hypothetical protein